MAAYVKRRKGFSTSFLQCISPQVAQSDVSLRRECLAAIGGEADMHGRVASQASVAHDPKQT
jgi:hypothetical protein